LQKEVSGDVVSLIYAYEWIPLYAIAALFIIEASSVIAKYAKVRLNTHSTAENKPLAPGMTV
jgi:hypothetical protein